MAILKKRVFKQAIEGGQEKSEIFSISNKYKNTLEDLINSSDSEYPIIPRQIDLPSDNISNFKDSPSDPKIDNDISNR